MAELFRKIPPPSAKDQPPSWAKIPFVPRPPISQRTEPLRNSPLTHIFDTNGVRALGRLKESSWQKLLAAWKVKGYTTGWVPWVALEITSTNFVFKDEVVSQHEVERVVCAVKRFDILAEGDVLPDMDQLFVRSMYECTGKPGGPSHLNEIEDDLRLRIHVCKQVTNRDQIGKALDGKGSYYVGFRDDRMVWYKAFKSNFASHALKAVAAMVEMVKAAGVTKHSSDPEVAQAILPLILPLILRKAERLKVPESVRGAVKKLWDPKPQLDPTKPLEPVIMPDASFTASMFSECWYYAEFARERLTREYLDNDGPDFKISSYMSLAKCFVTNDVNLRKLISHYTIEAERRIIRSFRFYRAALA